MCCWKNYANPWHERNLAMADHNANALHAAVKALAQVVAPSVDPRNPLAVEQLRLVSLYLEFHAKLFPLERRLAWKDLHLQAELARQAASLLHEARPDLAQRLREQLNEAEAQLALPVGTASLWQASHSRLAEALAEAIAQVQQTATLRDALEALVLAHARGQLMLHRVWFLPFGFEARPDTRPALEELLSGTPNT